MFSMRTLLTALIFTNIWACSLLAMNMDFYAEEPARIGDRDATYQYMVDSHGERQQKINVSRIFDFCDPRTKQLFDGIATNDQKKLKNMLDESATKGSPKLNAEFNGMRALEMAMLKKNHQAASILLLYGANIEHVRCREHRGFLRLLKNQAEAIARRAPRAQSYCSGSNHAQSAPQTDDDTPGAQEQEVFPINHCPSQRHSLKSALRARQEPLDSSPDDQADADGESDGKVDTGCHFFGNQGNSITCCIQ